MGRATVEAVLQTSAEQVSGPKAQGRRGSDREVYYHGVQGGRVALKERQLRVAKPRLRKKRRRADESGEVEVPAYTVPQADQRAGCEHRGHGADASEPARQDESAVAE